MEATGLVDGRFEIQHLAGEGGMGAVYRALDVETGQPVAIKLLHNVRLTASVRFEREAQVLAELRHPNIVRYITHGVAGDGRPYLVMAWLAGESLEERLRRGPLSVGHGLVLARVVAEALAVAHSRGIVHRDLKPSNLFLGDGRIENTTIIDFGIARDPAQPTLTDRGAMLGTIGYMPPEQARGDRIDARADVFALGAVLFECLVGRTPFDARDPLESLVRLSREDAPRVRAHRPAVAPAFDEVIARMLSRDANHRPSDAGAVTRELAAIAYETDTLPDDTVSAPTADFAVVWPERAPPGATASPRSLETPPPATPPLGLEVAKRALTRRRGGLVAWVVGAGGVACSAVVVGVLATRDAPRIMLQRTQVLGCPARYCKPLRVSDPDAIDVGEVLPAADAFAREIAPTAKLVAITIGPVESGRVTVNSPFNVAYNVTKPESPDKFVQFSIGVLGRRLVATPEYGLPAEAKEVPRPKCSVQGAWTAARAAGVPDAGSVTFLYAALGWPLWHVGVPADYKKSVYVDASSCTAMTQEQYAARLQQAPSH